MRVWGVEGLQEGWELGSGQEPCFPSRGLGPALPAVPPPHPGQDRAQRRPQEARACTAPPSGPTGPLEIT